MGDRAGTRWAGLAELGVELRAATPHPSVILWDGRQEPGARVAGATQPAFPCGWSWWTDIPGGPHLRGVTTTPQAAKRAMVAHYLHLRASDAVARLGGGAAG